MLILIGISFIPYPGVQNDEAYFAAAVYEPGGYYFFALQWGHIRIPLMLLDYLGTLKAWLYKPILAVWAPSPWSLRVPVVLIGALTIWLFFRLLDTAAGQRAAVIGAYLLATDPMFILTTTLDWGPVALQHLLAVGGVWCLLLFHRSARRARLCGGCFLFGLALWDKALFLWTLGGLVVAALAVFPRESFRAVSRRNLAFASLCLCLGAAPLICYNIARPMATLRSSASFSTREIPAKLYGLRDTLNGSSLFGYMVEPDDDTPVARAPASLPERLSVTLSRTSGQPRQEYLGVALLVAAALIPLVWRTGAGRTATFALVCMLAAWGQMAITERAGVSVHHTVLLWPWPQFLIAVVFAEARRRWRLLVAAAVTLLAAANLLVLNQYLAQFIRNGARASWTDAIFPLSDYLGAAPASHVWIVDWGMFDNLTFLQKGKLPSGVAGEPVQKAQPDESDRRMLSRFLSTPDSLWVGHTEQREEVTGVNARLAAMALELGYRKEVLKVIGDRNGRPVFEVFRFRPIRVTR